MATKKVEITKKTSDDYRTGYRQDDQLRERQYPHMGWKRISVAWDQYKKTR